MAAIVSIKSGTVEEFRRIELSDGSFFSFKTCYLPPAFIQNLYNPGIDSREISAGEEEGLRFASSCLRAEKAALRLIARAEQCMSGLARKLERRGHDSACVSAALSRLAGMELVDDRRFARLWLESRLSMARSPRRLLVSLSERGISRDAAEAALKTVLDEETELAMLARFVEKLKKMRKYRDKIEGNAGIRSFKFLLKNEGFSYQAIKRYFDN